VIPLLLLLLACTPDPGRDSAKRGDSEVQDSGPRVAWSLEAQPHETIGSILRVSWEQPEPDTVRVSWLDGETWVDGPAEHRGQGDQQALLLGVPFGAELQLRVRGDRSESETITVSSDPLPEALEHAAVLTDTSTEAPAFGWVFTSLVGMTQGESWALILDRQGRVVWALKSPDGRLSLQPRLARDGASLLIDHNSFYGSLDGGAGSQVLRITIDGVEQALYDTPGLHHGFAETDAGLAWGATDGDSFDTLELLDEVGARRTLWDCAPFHAQLGSDQACQNNGVSWDPASGRFLVSFFSTNGVVELDTEGSPTRWFGQLPGAWSFEPSDSAFWWQHDARLTDDGALLLSTHRSAMSDELTLREYNLDEEGERLVQVWSHDSGVQAELGGSAQRLVGGSTLQGTGDGGQIRELTRDGVLVWGLDLGPEAYLGRVSAIEDLYALLP
jgi:hypothetical protein